MLRSLNELRGFRIHAMDGTLGRVRDLFFDDRVWMVRYFVVDTRAWLPGRHVLVSPVVITRADWAEQAIRVTLTKDQVKDGPGVESDRPVSRQKEARLAEYYAWPMYWGTPDLGVPPPPVRPGDGPAPHESEAGAANDPHLRSVREVVGYRIEAADGEIGRVADFLGDDASWTVRYLVVDMGESRAGKRTLLSPTWIDAVDWAQARVVAGTRSARIREAPDYDPDVPITREYEARLHAHYDRPGYWSATPGDGP